ncbi:MAG: hypothetical protein Q8P41_10885 [Pseudomonadota bacterium]|nr:hypothetical protein [Pseudomonadota bacterium]
MVLALALLGCAQTIELDSGGASTPARVAGTIREACDAGTPETMTLDASFPERPPGCAWGEDGNLEAQQAVITARAEDIVTLDMPPGVALCDVGFDFQGEDHEDEQIVRYDDVLVLTFDDVVLASSYARLVEGLESEGLFRLYDWDDLVGEPFQFDDASAYCLGADAGLSSCRIPPQETAGTLALDFGADVVSDLAEYAYAQGRYEFALLTLGDNDAEVDCSHSEFRFTVDVAYVPY